MANPWSINAPRASRNSHNTGDRGGSSRPATPWMNAESCAPDTRTMPIAPRPGAVAIAAIVSERAVIGGEYTAAIVRLRLGLGRIARVRAFEHAIDVPLLHDGQHVVHEPVQHQAGGEEEEEDAECYWHNLHDFGLHRIRWLRIELGLYDHGGAHQNGEKTNWHAQ